MGLIDRVGKEYVAGKALGASLFLFYNILNNKVCRNLITESDLQHFLREKLVPIIAVTRRDVKMLSENPVEFIKERDETSFWNDTDCLMLPKKEALAIVRYLFCKREKNVPLLKDLLDMCSTMLGSTD